MLIRKSVMVVLSIIMVLGISVNIKAQLDIGDVGVVMVENAPLKEIPKNFSPTLHLLQLNDEIIIWDYNDSWFEVEAGDHFGWVKKELIGKYKSVPVVSHDEQEMEEGDVPHSDITSITDLTGFDYEIYQAYKQESDLDFQTIQHLHNMTDAFQNDPYNIFMQFREEAQIGEYSPDDYSEIYRLEDYIGEQNQGIKAIKEYTEILNRNDWKEIEKHYLGMGATAQMLTDYSLLEDESVYRYVNAIGQTLAMSSRKSTTYNGYRFAVLDTDETTVFSNPSGHVFISKGLIKKLENEDELAALLAREIGNITHNVHLKRIEYDLLLKVFSFFATAINEVETVDDYYAVVKDSRFYLRCMFTSVVEDVVEAIKLKPSSMDRLRAEKEALLTLYHAGYNPYVVKESVVIAENLNLTPFNDDRALVGELEEDQSPLEEALDFFELDNPTIPQIRFDRFKEFKDRL
jgi:hypothetical protein